MYREGSYIPVFIILVLIYQAWKYISSAARLNTLETSGKDVKTTLERSGEDVKNTLETSGEDDYQVGHIHFR